MPFDIRISLDKLFGYSKLTISDISRLCVLEMSGLLVACDSQPLLMSGQSGKWNR